MEKRGFSIFLVGLLAFQSLAFGGPATLQPSPGITEPMISKPVIPDVIVPKPNVEPFTEIQGASPKANVVSPEGVFLTPTQVFFGTLFGTLFYPWGQKDAKESGIPPKGFVIFGPTKFEHFYERHRAENLLKVHLTDPFWDQASIFNSISSPQVVSDKEALVWMEKGEELFRKKNISYKNTKNSSWGIDFCALQILPDAEGSFWNKRAFELQKKFNIPMFFMPQVTEYKYGPKAVVKMNSTDPSVSISYDVLSWSEKRSFPSFDHEITHLRGEQGRIDGFEVPMRGSVRVNGSAHMLGSRETDFQSYQRFLSFDEPLAQAVSLFRTANLDPTDFIFPETPEHSLKRIASMGEQTSRYVASWANSMVDELPDTYHVIVDELGVDKVGTSLGFNFHPPSDDIFIEIPVQDPEVEEMVRRVAMIKLQQKPYHKWTTEKITKTLKSDSIQIYAYATERFEKMAQIAQQFQEKFIKVKVLLHEHKIEEAKAVARQFFPLVEEYISGKKVGE